MSKVYPSFPTKALLFVRASNEESNFKQVLLLRAEDDQVLRKWIEKSYDKHVSLNAQNEILQIMALKLLRAVASDITESGYYSVMADESSEASNIELLVICICWEDKEMEVCEEYIGLMVGSQISPDTIVVCIKEVLLHMISEFKMLVGSALKDVRP